MTTPILEELYQVEPELRKKEEHIEKIVTHMIDLKPKVNVPENFKKVLKNRLLQEKILEKEVYAKNKRFRIFWYILGTGVFASFAVGFSILSILEVDTIKKVPLQNTDMFTKLQDTTTDTIVAPKMMKESIVTEIAPVNSISNTKEMDKPIIPPPIKTPSIEENNAGQSTIAGKIDDTTGISSVKSVGTESDTDSSRSTSPSQESTIAYVGEDLEIPASEPSSGSSTFSDAAPKTMSPVQSPDSSTASDMSASGNSPTITPLPVTQPELTFPDIVARAQLQANTIIEAKDRSLYILKTPHMTYVSRESKTLKDTIEMVMVYVFPLEKIDGEKREIKVTVE